jgi:hypothetical protein
MITIGGMPTNLDERAVTEMLQRHLRGNVDERSLLFPKVYGGRFIDRDLEIMMFLMSNGSAPWKGDIMVDNACVCIEVKGHRQVEFGQSTRIRVTTKDKDVYPVEQARESSQMAKSMLQKRGINHVFYFACFPNISLASLPDEVSTDIIEHSQFPYILFRDEIDITSILTKLRHQWKAKKGGNRVASTQIYTALNLAIELPTVLSGVKKDLVVGKFDLHRFEKITSSNTNINNYVRALDDDDIILKGRAGSGKSVCAIKLAHRYANTGSSVLLCTYNIALARDLERLHKFYLKKEDHSPTLQIIERGDVDIDNIDHVIFRYANNVRELVSTDDNSETSAASFEDQKRIWRVQIRRLIDVFGAKEARDLLRANYKLVVIDEAQDVEKEDYELLRYLFGDSTRFAFIHSPDQTLRIMADSCVSGSRATEFTRQTVYRNYRKIAKYAGRLQRRLGRHLVGDSKTKDAEQESADDVYAELIDGNVGIYNGSMDVVVEHVNRLIEEASAVGYDQWSTMVIVPGEDVGNRVIEALSQSNIKCWNGLQKSVRSDEYCPDHVRIVDYRSCRGLEAYNVIVYDPASAIERELNVPVQDSRKTALAANHIFVAVSRAICNLAIVMPGPKHRDVFEHCLQEL